LKSNGKVEAVGDNRFEQCNVSSWTDIVQIAAGWYHTVGLKSDGSVVAVGWNLSGQCSVEYWRDIVRYRKYGSTVPHSMIYKKLTPCRTGIERTFAPVKEDPYRMEISNRYRGI